MKLTKWEKASIEGTFYDEEYWEHGGGDKPGYNGMHTLTGMNHDMAIDFAPIFGLQKDTRVLDLGCAAGMMVVNWVKMGIDAYGIDISQYAINWGEEHYDLEGRIFHGSIHDLSRWPDDHFDFLYSQQVFEHIPEAFCEQMAKECFRVHKPGGKMWVGLEFRPYGMSQDEKLIHRDPMHLNGKHKEWWDRIFCAAGYRICWDLEIAMIEHSAMWKKLRWHQLAYIKPFAPQFKNTNGMIPREREGL